MTLIFSLNALESILIACGITFLINYASLFKKLREKVRFFKCPLCLGFWIGLLFALLNTPYETFASPALWLFYAFKLGIVTSILSFPLYHFMGALEKPG